MAKLSFKCALQIFLPSGALQGPLHDLCSLAARPPNCHHAALIALAPLHPQGSRYEMLETRKDGIKFTSEALRQAATQLQTFSGQYESRQGHLVEQVTCGADDPKVHHGSSELQHCNLDPACSKLSAECCSTWSPAHKAGGAPEQIMVPSTWYCSTWSPVHELMAAPQISSSHLGAQVIGEAHTL
jgi:hypothetical protein